MANGKQCCLGFVCRHYGATTKDILAVGMPMEVQGSVQLPSWLRYRTNRCDVYRAATINDNADISERERESKIRAIFKRHGIRAVFTK